MPLELRDADATLSGVVTVDEVEPLVVWLRATAAPRIDLGACNHLHTGALQAILLFRPTITAAPADGFLAGLVLPLLSMGNGAPDQAEGDPP